LDSSQSAVCGFILSYDSFQTPASQLLLIARAHFALGKFVTLSPSPPMRGAGGRSVSLGRQVRRKPGHEPVLA
ncbi:MAG: hypothetical protein ACRDH2_20895, partial [Anaerolineales bacterium]